MKIISTILILIAIAASSSAQIDTVKIDSVMKRVDSFRQSKLSVLDSAQLKLGKATDKVLLVNKSLTNYDTLGQSIQAALAKRKAKLTSKIDSLKSAGLPYNKYSEKLDSLNKINPLPQYQSVESKISEGQSKIDAGKAKVQQLQNAPEQKINEKLNVLSSEAKGKGNLPSSVNVPDAKLPDTNLNIEKPDLNIDRPSLDLKNNPLDKDIKTDIDLPKIDKPKELEKVNEVQEKVTGSLSEVSGKVSGYTQDVKNISKGNIDEVKTLKDDALAKVSLDEEIKVLDQGEALINEQKAMLESLKNPEEFRKQTLARAKQITIKQLAAHQKLVQEATDKVARYQRTAGTILSKKKDLPKKRDALRKLKFYEKFVPGLTLQVQKPGAWLVDINSSLRYRLTSYWSVGSGWNDRVIFGNSIQPGEEIRVFGVRSFTEVIIFKGISMRLDADRMNAYVTPFLKPKDTGDRKWTWAYMAGIKKEFTFMPRVVGNVQFMYNLYDPQHYRIYPTRFNVRFGFEYPMNKRKKKRGS